MRAILTGLDERVELSVLKELVNQFCPIGGLSLPTNSKDGKGRRGGRVATISFLCEEHYKLCCDAFSGIKLFGRPLRMEEVTWGQVGPDKGEEVVGVVYLAGLPQNVPQKKLRDVLGLFGRVCSLFFHGSWVACYASRESALLCASDAGLNGQMFCGHRVRAEVFALG